MSDLISRQAAIEAVTKYCTKHDLRDLLADLEVLPSAEQEQKTGKWIEKGRSLGIPESVCYTCSECGNAWWNVKGDWKFCPKCGAKMESEEG